MVRDPTRYCKCMSEERLVDMFCERRPSGLGRDVDDIRRANSAFVNASPFSEERALSLRKPAPRLRFFSDVDNNGIPVARPAIIATPEEEIPENRVALPPPEPIQFE